MPKRDLPPPNCELCNLGEVAEGRRGSALRVCHERPPPSPPHLCSPNGGGEDLFCLPVLNCKGVIATKWFFQNRFFCEINPFRAEIATPEDRRLAMAGNTGAFGDRIWYSLFYADTEIDSKSYLAKYGSAWVGAADWRCIYLLDGLCGRADRLKPGGRVNWHLAWAVYLFPPGCQYARYVNVYDRRHPREHSCNQNRLDLVVYESAGFPGGMGSDL